MTVWKYCKINNLNYDCVRYSIKYFNDKDDTKNLNDIIEMVITKFLRLYENKRIIKFIENLEESNNYNFLAISKELNIEYQAMYRVYKEGFTKKSAFYIVWFLHDILTKNGKISISKKRIKEFKEIYYNKNFDDDTNLLDVFVMVKLGSSEALNYLVSKRSPNILSIIKRNVFNKDYYKSYFDDIKNEVLLNELKLYKNIYLNNIPQIIRYLNIHAKYRVIDYLKNNKNVYCISLDEEVFDGKNGYDFVCRYDNYWEY
ncbi:MAG: hypothetical protein NC483_05960 [Ruminococcus sp.]|nr:hypothetical protein [Ruminococcus sp.]